MSMQWPNDSAISTASCLLTNLFLLVKNPCIALMMNLTGLRTVTYAKDGVGEHIT